MADGTHALATRHRIAARVLAVALSGAALLGACGRNGDGKKNDERPPESKTGPVCTGAISPGPSPLRRLTNYEYNNTVRDLLGDTTAPAREFAEAGEVLGFDNNADILNVTELLAEQYMRAAEQLAETAAADPAKLLGCDGKDPCVRTFIETFGERAWRRPLDTTEVDRLFALYSANKASGVQVIVQALLQSPNFLYRVEFGAPKPGEAHVALSDWEMASRLSYLLWGSMPDEELFAAARAGKLRSKEEVRAQAERMIASPRARDMVVNFHAQWLRLADIDLVEKNTAVYPQYTPELRPLLRRETEEFVARTILDEGGSLTTLLTARHTFMNKQLADFYGVSGPSGDAWQRVELDPARSAGLLTHAGHLAALSKPNQSSPVHRGKFIREQVLCQHLTPPPPNVDVTPPDLDPNLTTRQRFAQHSADATCRACHYLMDPIGLGFEQYDGMGKWRDSEYGLPIDASGSIEESDVKDKAFNGPVELANKLAASSEVQNCITTQWFRYSYGRAESEADACTLESLKAKFRESGGNIKSLIIELTQTDAFMYRSAADAGGKQ